VWEKDKKSSYRVGHGRVVLGARISIMQIPKLRAHLLLAYNIIYKHTPLFYIMWYLFAALQREEIHNMRALAGAICIQRDVRNAFDAINLANANEKYLLWMSSMSACTHITRDEWWVLIDAAANTMMGWIIMRNESEFTLWAMTFF